MALRIPAPPSLTLAAALGVGALGISALAAVAPSGPVGGRSAVVHNAMSTGACSGATDWNTMVPEGGCPARS